MERGAPVLPVSFGGHHERERLVLVTLKTCNTVRLHYPHAYVRPIGLLRLISLSLPAPENRPPGMVPAKGRHMGKDLRRLSAYYSVPLHLLSVS